MTQKTTPWTRDEMRRFLDDVSTRLEEWDAIVGPAEGDDPAWDKSAVGDDLTDLRRAVLDATFQLARFSLSLWVRGMEAAGPEDAP